MIFLDASVLLAAEDTDDVHHKAAAALLETGALATLDLAVYEVINVAERRWRDADAGARLRQRLWAIAELGVLVRADPRLSARTAELAREHQLSSYDAAYVAAAQRLSLPLASCDQRNLVARGLAELPAALLDQRTR
ncbi:MAG TPA: type II toxin-antitoxin system VapC family toxin [Acidimicrobiales bacterium]|nr:type II toxin-antitoxin system VapC family toxin [Acidimicrobiales bacterium]